MRKLFPLAAFLACLVVAGCSSDGTRQVATMNAPRAATACGGAASYAAPETVPGYAWGLSAADNARAALIVPGNIAGCVADLGTDVLQAGAKFLRCLGTNLVPPNPAPSLYAVSYPAPAAAPRAAPCAASPAPAASPPAAAPTPTLVAPPKKAPCQACPPLASAPNDELKPAVVAGDVGFEVCTGPECESPALGDDSIPVASK